LNKKYDSIIPKNGTENTDMDVNASNADNEIIQKKPLKFQQVLGISSIFWNF
jgi:hypothetical protein